MLCQFALGLCLSLRLWSKLKRLSFTSFVSLIWPNDKNTLNIWHCDYWPNSQSWVLMRLSHQNIRFIVIWMMKLVWKFYVRSQRSWCTSTWTSGPPITKSHNYFKKDKLYRGTTSSKRWLPISNNTTYPLVLLILLPLIFVLLCLSPILCIPWVFPCPHGGHSIIKLKTTCKQSLLPLHYMP